MNLQIIKYFLAVIMFTHIYGCTNDYYLPNHQEGEAPDFAGGNRASDFDVLDLTPELIHKYQIDDNYYSKYTMVWGIPITASNEVEDIYLKNAAELVGLMLSDQSLQTNHSKEIRDILYQKMLRISIFPANEYGTKQLPEYKQFDVADAYGATEELPMIGVSTYEATECVNGPEEDQGRTRQGNSLVHEIMHTIHLFAADKLFPGFSGILKTAYENAKRESLWKPYMYIIDTNELEYLAEGAEIWFNWQPYTIDLPDGDFVRMKQEHLKERDPSLYKIFSQIFIPEIDVMNNISFCSPRVRLTFFPNQVTNNFFTGKAEFYGDGKLIDSYSFNNSYPEVSFWVSDPRYSYLKYERYTFQLNLDFDNPELESQILKLEFTQDELLNLEGFPDITLNF
ncbi:MAG: hypothetical protein N4A37_12065 [Prolixibacteraceae bacterium]|jgi:hypothetical protein|nr:hypothetical protein [Prolixibacteraceae bacterium]